MHINAFCEENDLKPQTVRAWLAHWGDKPNRGDLSEDQQVDVLRIASKEISARNLAAEKIQATRDQEKATETAYVEGKETMDHALAGSMAGAVYGQYFQSGQQLAPVAIQGLMDGVRAGLPGAFEGMIPAFQQEGRRQVGIFAAMAAHVQGQGRRTLTGGAQSANFLLPDSTVLDNVFPDKEETKSELVGK